MRLRYAAMLIATLVTLVACGSPAATITRAPTPEATVPAPAGTFYFTTEDGVTLNGQIMGQGKTAIVFSNGQEVSKISWQPVAARLAERGYLTMLYDYRGIAPSQGRDELERRDRDLRAALGVVRARGATSVVLVGSSFGGTLSAALAAEVQPLALIILSAPLAAATFTISDGNLRALKMPKLFLASQDDSRFVGPTQHMYEVSPQPKRIHIYAGNTHGNYLFLAPDTADDAMGRITAFLQAYAPAA